MTHEKLGTLAERLEFANALLKQMRRELSHERIERGKDAAYIAELEARLAKPDPEKEMMRAKIERLESLVRVPPKTAEQKTIDRLTKAERELKSCREGRNKLIAELFKA